MAKKKDKAQQAVSGGFVPATQQSAKQGAHAAQAAAGAASTSGAIGMAGQYSRNNPEYKDHTRNKDGMSRGGKIAIAVVLVLIAAGLIATGVYLYKETQKSVINADLHKMTTEQMEALDEQLTGSTKFDEPFNVLLLGSDARADDPDMGARTDTIIVVRVFPDDNTISMMSIPRDTMIEIDGVGTQKFNAAYTYGGASGTIAAVKKLCGIDIDHYAEINFEGLVGLVDAIGGIDVEVDEEIDDWDAGGHVDAGKQHLDGEHALILARSRAYVDGDYTRQANQRKVIMAIVNKALTAPASELAGLIQASTKFLTTDSGIDFDFVYSLADQIRHNNDKPVQIFSATIPSSTSTINGVSYVIADTAGVEEMVKTLMEGGDISQGVSASSIASDIANAGGNQTPSDVGTTGQQPEGETNGEEQQYYDEEGYAEGEGETEVYTEEADQTDEGQNDADANEDTGDGNEDDGNGGDGDGDGDGGDDGGDGGGDGDGDGGDGGDEE